MQIGWAGAGGYPEGGEGRLARAGPENLQVRFAIQDLATEPTLCAGTQWLKLCGTPHICRVLGCSTPALTPPLPPASKALASGSMSVFMQETGLAGSAAASLDLPVAVQPQAQPPNPTEEGSAPRSGSRLPTKAAAG